MSKLDELIAERDELREEALELIDNDNLEEARLKKEAIAELNLEIEKIEGEEVVEERKLPIKEVDVQVPEVTNEEVRSFKNYLQGEIREIDGGNLKTDSGFVLIPEEVVTDILKLKEFEYNLDKYVTVKSVSNGSGKYPVVRQSQVQALPTVEELAPNPELAVKPFFTLEYDVKTHRGYFRVSREAIEDAKVNVLNELKLWLARTIAATRNAAIIDVLQNGGPGEDGANTQLPQEIATSVDDLKDIINTNILPNYEHNVAIVSQSAWASIDKLKDASGNYLVQPDIKDASAKRLLGARVEILPDEVVGADTLVFGNLKDTIVLFDRSKYQAQWTDYMHFGECLMVSVRQDVRLLDAKASVVISLDLTAPTEPPAGE